MGKLSELPNVGKALEEQLSQAGIETYEELKALGSRGAWLQIRENDPSACLHRLYALEGAVRGIPKSQLPAEDKEALKEFYREIQAK